MEERGLTQAALAKLLDVSQPTVSDWINGNMKPTADTLLDLSAKTGISIDELLRGNVTRKRKRN
jgi:transcriptional regulator with XRE-family HTH domain